MLNFENLIAEDALKKINKRFEDLKWKDKKYEVVKKSSTTARGDFGEDITAKAFEMIGIECILSSTRRGDWDTKTVYKNVTKLLENKLATEDVHGNFQFNGIKLNRHYDYVFCLGVSPDQIYFKIVPKNELELKKEWGFCSMTKKNEKEDKMSLAYKMTISKNNMLPISELLNIDLNLFL